MRSYGENMKESPWDDHALKVHKELLKDIRALIAPSTSLPKVSTQFAATILAERRESDWRLATRNRRSSLGAGI